MMNLPLVENRLKDQTPKPHLSRSYCKPGQMGHKTRRMLQATPICPGSSHEPGQMSRKPSHRCVFSTRTEDERKYGTAGDSSALRRLIPLLSGRRFIFLSGAIKCTAQYDSSTHTISPAISPLFSPSLWSHSCLGPMSFTTTRRKACGSRCGSPFVHGAWRSGSTT